MRKPTMIHPNPAAAKNLDAYTSVTIVSEVFEGENT
jgi:hypothetical protein